MVSGSSIERMFDSDADTVVDGIDGFGGVDPIALIREGLACLAGEDRSGWPAGVVSDLVLDLLAVRERLDAEVLRTVGRWDAMSAWADDGALSGSGWLADRAELTRGAARRLVRTAGLAYRNDRTAEALAEGTITATAVETMATLVGRHEEIFPEHEETLVKIARTLRADDFVVSMRHWRSIADDNDDPDPDDRFERRFFRISPTLDGAKIDGFLDPDAAAVVGAALDAIDRPDPVNSATTPRSLGQRRADALVELARESLAFTERGGSIPPNVDAVLDVNDVLADRLGDPSEGIIPAHAVHQMPVSRAAIERLCCDASIGRVIMRGKSEVLDVGRRSRLVTQAQMRALILRDQHCRFPGCDRPPQWTDVHHLIHSFDGGTTDFDNLVLLCRRHHVMCHEGGWILQRDPEGEISAHRPIKPKGPRPRGPSPPSMTLAA
jgi:hypothetical protein